MRLIAIEPQPDEFDAWQAYQAREYSREKVTSGAWSAESALARAETENAALLPNGFAITGHHIRRIEDKATQELIGWIWVSLAGDTRRASCRSCSDGRNGTFRRKRNLGPALPRGDSRARRNRPCIKCTKPTPVTTVPQRTAIIVNQPPTVRGRRIQPLVDDGERSDWGT